MSAVRSASSRGNSALTSLVLIFVMVFIPQQTFQSISLWPRGRGLHALLCPTLCDSQVQYSPRGSSVHGVAQARILCWVAISSSRGSVWSRDRTHNSCTCRPILYHWATWEAPQKRLETLITYVARLPHLASKDSLEAQSVQSDTSGNVLEA